MPVSECGGGELVPDGGVGTLGICRRRFREGDVAAGHDLGAEDAGEEVAVHDVLVLAHQEAATLLKYMGKENRYFGGIFKYNGI